MRHLATAKVFLRRPEVKGGGRSMISINIVKLYICTSFLYLLGHTLYKRRLSLNTQ